jgi:CheY-like chemotaxis protein
MARILVVYDDEADRILLRTMLADEGHDVHLAGDGDEALALCRQRPVDVVMTDLQMPGVHGLELISHIRDLSPRPAIVAVSGTGETQLDVAEMIGADHTLAKPVEEAPQGSASGS